MDALLYTRLSTDSAITGLVTDRIFPVMPSVDTKLPFIVYTKTSTEDVLSLNGPTGLTIYTYTLDFWTINIDDNLNLADSITARLRGWTSANVKGAFREDDSATIEEVGFHGTQTYRFFVV